MVSKQATGQRPETGEGVAVKLKRYSQVSTNLAYDAGRPPSCQVIDEYSYSLSKAIKATGRINGKNLGQNSLTIAEWRRLYREGID